MVDMFIKVLKLLFKSDVRKLEDEKRIINIDESIKEGDLNGIEIS